MKKVVVILPTYNGGKYLEESLDSLYNQTYPNIEIYTRDDGSSDNTVEIIKNYAKKKVKGRKITIVPNGGKSLKCPDCFTKLLEIAGDGDYYCYCDQDDVWLPNKIEAAVKAIEQYDSNEPTLHFGAYDYYTSDLKFMNHSPKIPANVSLRNILYDYWPLGFNITFNKALYDVVFNNLPKRIYYHDCFVAQVAAGVGNFIYSSTPSVKYRRQEQAVTYSNHSKFSLFVWRIKRFFGSNNDNLIQLKKILEEYFVIFDEYLSEYDKKILNIFTVDNTKNYFRRIFFPHRLRLKLIDEIGLRLLFVFKKL